MTDQRLVALPHTHRDDWPGSTFVEPLASDRDVVVTAWLPPRPDGRIDRNAAFALAAKPPRERGYATPKALAQRTAADPAHAAAVQAYCERSGIRVVQSHWRSMELSGPLDRLVDAFGATVASFADAGGRRFRHRSGSLHAPPEVARAVRAVLGMHQWPRSQKLGGLARHVTPLAANDVIERYAFPDGDGADQTIAVVQFRGEFRAADFDRSMQSQSVTAAHPVVKRVDDAAVHHEIETTKDLEAALDVQIIAALAPRARVVIYEAPDDERGFLDAIRTAIFDDEYRPSILSISYGWAERLWTPIALTLLDELFGAASLLGISVFASSGDHGAELDARGKPHVVAPASSPFVHACGGTTIAPDTNGESVWENSGAGSSETFDAPPWQPRGGRAVPDVAAQVVPGYTVYLEETELAIGGTSAVAPLYAALTARINARLGVRAGLMTPLLYASPATGLRDSGPRTGLGVPIGTGIEAALRASGERA